jgi:hypothetical protein
MPIKLTYEYVKDFINNENELISKEYINNRELLEILCKKCNKKFFQCFGNYNRGCRCKSCSMSENGKKSAKIRYGNKIPIRDMITVCIQCNSNFSPVISKQKLCNKKCATRYTQTKEYKEQSKINGKKGGLASAASQQRRSKNEIACAELCIEYFGKDDIQCNEQIFKDKNDNFWDCDIYIKSLKIAILWDGFYFHHGPNVSKQQKARDKLKRQIILDNDCEYYTIIDKGKFNKEFVKEQFDLFIHKQTFKECLNIIINQE